MRKPVVSEFLDDMSRGPRGRWPRPTRVHHGVHAPRRG